MYEETIELKQINEEVLRFLIDDV